MRVVNANKPLIPAMRPWRSKNKAAAVPMRRPPATAISGERGSMSIPYN
jgi:hypothetical protein